MIFRGKKVGVWGYGVVGKSAVPFLIAHGAQVTVFDRRSVSLEDETALTHVGVLYRQETDSASIHDFLDAHEYILASAGVDIRPYNAWHSKIISELDIFYTFFKKPIIAITGTVGKTTTTTLIAHALERAGYTVITGGNIGVGLCDFLTEQYHAVDYAVLELSSFQLERSRIFCPTIAVITNIYHNHLDRHSTFDEYVNAKMSMIYRQTAAQKALAPIELYNEIAHKTAASVSFFSHTNKSGGDIDNLFFVDAGMVYVQSKGATTPLLSLSSNDETNAYQWTSVMQKNVACAAMVLSLLCITPTSSLFGFSSMAHRMEYVATVNGVVFYNDSKSTIPESTYEAVVSCSQPPVLFLGGLSKGIDRERLIGTLTGRVSFVACFGAEAVQLQAYCVRHGIASHAYTTLEDAFNDVVRRVQTGETVLFSPAGSSFDLFANYQERGERFKQLVYQYCDTFGQTLS